MVNAYRIELLLHKFFFFLIFILIELALYILAVFVYLLLFWDFSHLSLAWVYFEVPLFYVLAVALSERVRRLDGGRCLAS